MKPGTVRYQFAAQIGSVIVVVLTLIFVGLEVRETTRQTALNTQANEIAAYQDLIAQILRFNELLLDPGIARTFEHMQALDASWSDFSPIERRQARALLYILVRHADMAFYQFQRGMLPQDRLESALRPLVSDLHRPVYRGFWQEIRMNQEPAFREYIDRRIGEGTP